MRCHILLTVAGLHRLSGRCRASCFPFNCTCERTCWHQTRAYDITGMGQSRPGVSLTRWACRPKLPGTLVLVCAFLCTQLNGKQGAHLRKSGPTCAAPATVSEGIAQAVQSRLPWMRARPRSHATTGREITRLGRGSGAFASPDTGQRRGLAPRGCGASSTNFMTVSGCCCNAVFSSPRFASSVRAVSAPALRYCRPAHAIGRGAQMRRLPPDRFRAMRFV